MVRIPNDDVIADFDFKKLACSNEHHLPCVVHAQPLVGDRRAREVAAQMLKLAALLGGTACPQEAVREDVAFEKRLELVFDK